MLFNSRKVGWMLILAALLGMACEATNRAASFGDGGDNDNTVGQESDTVDPNPEDTETDTGFAENTDPTVTCAEGTEKIYLVDADRSFYSFDPKVPGNGAFQPIAKLSCKITGQPYSMSVSRDGFAYVLYVKEDALLGTQNCSGVAKVNIQTGECLGATPFKCNNQAGFKIFGMGFTTDQAGGNDETLYIAGAQSNNTFGILDVETGDVAKVGAIPAGDPEFTGNGNGELWGFFPGSIPSSVMQLDKQTGAVKASFPLAALPNSQSATSFAYAFAYWGGAFYIFYQVAPSDASTNVWKLDAQGAVTKAWANTGKRIVGAGVSTCAPTQTY